MIDTVRGDTDLASVGALIGEPARARILLALADGRALPASMLAAEARVANSTASEHLRRLTDGGLLTVATHGRHRYYQLSGPPVADMIEAIARIAPRQQISSLREGTRAHALRKARRCYDHLAGRLGVAVTDAFISHGYLTGHDGSIDLSRLNGNSFRDPIAYTLTPAGARTLRELGAEPPPNPAVRCCVDWTEKRHHMAGPAGRALLTALEQHGWVRPHRYHRALTLTDEGAAELTRLLGIPSAQAALTAQAALAALLDPEEGGDHAEHAAAEAEERGRRGGQVRRVGDRTSGDQRGEHRERDQEPYRHELLLRGRQTGGDARGLGLGLFSRHRLCLVSLGQRMLHRAVRHLLEEHAHRRSSVLSGMPGA